MAACIARLCPPPFVDGEVGGAGGVDREGPVMGGRGGGGAAGGGGADEEGIGGAEENGGEGASVLGFLTPGGTGGFFPIGGGGPFMEADDAGLGAFTPAVFLRFATEGKDVAPDPFCGVGLGGRAVGGFGATMVGGLGTELVDDSGSDVYDDSRFAPVSTPPPRFFSFGIPPANKPANCGGCSIPDTPPESLLV